MPEPGRWRGRVTPRDNAILIALIVICVPLVTYAVLTLEDTTTPLVIVTAYIALIAIVAVAARLRFERLNRK